MAPLGPPMPAQPLLLGHGFAPPGYPPPPRPQMRGSSSRPFLHCRSLGLTSTAPDLGRGVTPLGCRPLGIGPPASAPDLGRGVAPLGSTMCASQLPTLFNI